MEETTEIIKEEPVKQEEKRNPDGTFKPGISGNPAGRPKGQSLKEYWRAKFYSMTDEEKEEFSKKVGFEAIWKMAEGNPKQDSDITSGGKPIVILSPEITAKNGITPSSESDSEGSSQI